MKQKKHLLLKARQCGFTESRAGIILGKTHESCENCKFKNYKVCINRKNNNICIAYTRIDIKGE